MRIAFFEGDRVNVKAAVTRLQSDYSVAVTRRAKSLVTNIDGQKRRIRALRGELQKAGMFESQPCGLLVFFLEKKDLRLFAARMMRSADLTRRRAPTSVSGEDEQPSLTMAKGFDPSQPDTA